MLRTWCDWSSVSGGYLQQLFDGQEQRVRQLFLVELEVQDAREALELGERVGADFVFGVFEQALVEGDDLGLDGLEGSVREAYRGCR